MSSSQAHHRSRSETKGRLEVPGSVGHQGCCLGMKIHLQVHANPGCATGPLHETPGEEAEVALGGPPLDLGEMSPRRQDEPGMYGPGWRVLDVADGMVGARGVPGS